MEHVDIPLRDQQQNQKQKHRKMATERVYVLKIAVEGGNTGLSEIKSTPRINSKTVP